MVYNWFSLIVKFHILTNEVHLCLAYKVILVSAAGWVPRFLQKATAQGAGNAKFNPERGQPSSWERLSIQQRWYETCKNGSVEKQLYHPTWHYPGMLYRCQGNAMPLGNVCHGHAWRKQCAFNSRVWSVSFRLQAGETAGMMRVEPWIRWLDLAWLSYGSRTFVLFVIDG